MPVKDRLAQRLRDADHHQQIAVGKPRQPRIERAQHIGFGAEMTGKRRAGKVDVVRDEHQFVDGVAHSLDCIRGAIVSCWTTARRGWVRR